MIHAESGEIKIIYATKNGVHWVLEMIIAKECVQSLGHPAVVLTTLFFVNRLFFERFMSINLCLVINKNLLSFLRFLFSRLRLDATFLERRDVMKKVNRHRYHVNGDACIKHFFLR